MLDQVWCFHKLPGSECYVLARLKVSVGEGPCQLKAGTPASGATSKQEPELTLLPGSREINLRLWVNVSLCGGTNIRGKGKNHKKCTEGNMPVVTGYE